LTTATLGIIPLPEMPNNSAQFSLDLADTNVRKLFFFKTRVGTFYIAEHNGRFHPVFDDESLGSYGTAQQAAEDLAGGHTFSISGGIDSSTLGIPEDVSEWKRLRQPKAQPSGAVNARLQSATTPKST
jgi:hypothetical protein